MSDNFGVYDITGELQTVASSTLPGTENLVRPLQRGILITELAAADLGSYDAVAQTLSWAGPGFTDQIGTKGIQIGDVLRWQLTIAGVTKDVFFDIVDVGNWQTGFPLVELFVKVKNGYDFTTMTSAVQSGSIFRASRFSKEDDTRPTGLNDRRSYERDVYNRLTQGKATRFEVAEDPPPGYVSSFSFGDPNPSAPYSSMTVSPPSWTQIPIGKHHEFVIGEMSSSQHEVTSMNAYLSGTQPLERTAVPASASRYYSKQSRFVSLTYKLSASANLPTLPGNERDPSQIENKPRNTFTAISGSYRNNSYYKPAIFNINVPERGKIRDIKVWVELVHDHRGGVGTGSANVGNPFWCGGSGSTQGDDRVGLGGLQIALKSPNVNFNYAHPMWNAPVVVGDASRKGADIVLVSQGTVPAVPPLLLGTYLLWAGHRVEEDLGKVIHTGSKPTGGTDANFSAQPQVYLSRSGSFVQGTKNIVIDSFGQAHVTFHDNIGARLFYASGSAAGFITRVVDGSGSSNFTVDNSRGNINSLAIGKNNIRHAAYTNDHDQSLWYARITGSDPTSWNITTSSIEPSAIGASGPSAIQIAVNPIDDSPMIATLHNSGFQQYQVKLYRSGSTGFVAETPITDANSRSTFSFVVSPDGTPNMFYMLPSIDNPYQSDLTHLRSGAGGWTETRFLRSGTLPNYDHPYLLFGAFSAGDNHITQDKNGLLQGAIVTTFFDDPLFQNFSNYGLTYLRSGSTGWKFEVIPGDNVFLAGASPRRIAVSNDGMVHIAGFRAPAGTNQREFLYIRSGTQSTWSTQVVSIGNTGSFYGTYVAGTLTVDSLNQPHFLWSDIYTPTVFTFATSSVDYVTLSGALSGANYFEFDNDIDMRTIFTDSSKNANPRDLTSLYPDATPSGQGSSKFWADRVRFGTYPSPTSGALVLFGGGATFPYLSMSAGTFVSDQVQFLTGANFPWMLDPRIPPGNFRGRNWSLTASLPRGGSPPVGWLNGAGGTAALNEFPTTGSQIGPSDIRAVYPLLEDIYVEKIYDEGIDNTLPFENHFSGGAVNNYVPSPFQRHGQVIGFRPGLRGTEINGTWQLIIGNTWQSGPTFLDEVFGPATGSERGGFWFRQFRLEFLVDQGEPLKWDYPGRARKYSKVYQVPSRPGRTRVGILSGSAEWDIGIDYMYTQTGEEYGRSIGITDSSGTTDFAVFTQLTGAFVGALSASGRLDGVEASFLQNEFGTPFIPISSGSGEAPNFDAYTSDDAASSRKIFQQILNPTTLIPKDNTLRAFLTRSKVTLTTRDAILKKTKK